MGQKYPFNSGLIMACLVAGLASIPAWAGSGPAVSNSKPFFDQPILLGAHRGGARLWPENTVLAYKECIKHWPNVLLEGDVYDTADHHLVVIHDGTVDRTTNGSGAVVDMTLAQIKKLDAGYRFTLDHGKTFPYRGKGITIPTLQEVLAATGQTRILIETKGGEGVAQATVDAIHAAGADQRVLLASFKPAHMAVMRAEAPNIARCYDFTTGMHLLTALRGGDWADYKPEADCLSLTQGLQKEYHLTSDEIARLHAKGIVTQIHTLNHRAKMEAMLKLGFDSILSDNPKLLAQAIVDFRNGNHKKETD